MFAVSAVGQFPRMTSLRSALRRGMLAGAAGTTALNGLTYLDMAQRGRPASDTPEQVVAALVERAGQQLPGRRGQRANRLAGLGPLAGSLAGVTVGGLGGVLRAAGLRLPAVLDAPLLAAGAMLATDVPMALLDVSDPRRWSRAAWVSDAVPHLGYGLVTHATLVAAEDGRIGQSAPAGCFARSLAIGAATGGRSSAGLTAVALSTDSRRTRGTVLAKLGRPGAKVVAALLAAGELTLDKSARAPSRLSVNGLPARILGGALSAAALAQRNRTDPGPQAVVGAAGAVGSAWLGNWWRGRAQRRFDSDLPGALIEDAAVALLAALACRDRPTP